MQVREVEEKEHANPTKVLEPKAKEYACMAAPMVSFLVEAGVPIRALSVMDLLGLDMPEVKGGQAAFGQSKRILKKPERSVRPEIAVTEHFASKLKQKAVEGYRWDVYIAGAAGIPVDSRGNMHEDRTKSFWGQPLWIGYSQAMIELFASLEKLNELVDMEVLLPHTVTSSSIFGLQAQNLLKSMSMIRKTKYGKGCAMRVIHTASNLDIVVDGSEGDASKLDPVFGLVDGALANVTPDLAWMLGNWMTQLVN
jgi:hypothetical protein